MRPRGDDFDKSENNINEYDVIYLENLQKSSDEQQTFYDKAILSLSGGALAITVNGFFQLIVNKIPLEYLWVLMFSFASWILSIVAVLFSFYFSSQAYDKNILDYKAFLSDKSKGYNHITPEGKLVIFLNSVSGAFFVIGLILLFIFIPLNKGAVGIGKNPIPKKIVANDSLS